MLEQGGGTIVNNASVLGSDRDFGGAAYVRTKHGVVGLTKSAALKFATRNIGVTSVCPGYTMTDLTAGTLTDPEKLEKAMDKLPTGRNAEPEEIAQTVLWLCGDASSYITGQSIAPDGGWSVW